jgi:hypothetical protein
MQPIEGRKIRNCIRKVDSYSEGKNADFVVEVVV